LAGWKKGVLLGERGGVGGFNLNMGGTQQGEKGPRKNRFFERGKKGVWKEGNSKCENKGSSKPGV